MDLFRLTFVTLLARKVWIVALVAAVLVPLVGPHLVPSETNIKLVEPAIAQASWSVTWLIGIFWTLSQAARFGDTNSRTGVGAYFRSQGCGALKQIFGIWSAIMVFLLPIVALAVAICLLFAMPGDPKEASMWVATNLQFAVLYVLTIGPLALLGVGLASRFGALVGYVLPTALCLYGLYGVGYVGMTMRDSPVLEWVYVLSPQYYLADLTPRLLLKSGQLPSADFLNYIAYFLSITAVLGSFATLLFRTDPLRN